MKDGRIAPFCYQSLAAMRVIKERFTGQERTAARGIYQALTEIANEQRRREDFEASRAEVCEEAGCSDRTLDKYVRAFEEFGLLRLGGRPGHPHLWSLVEPDQGCETVSHPPKGEAKPFRPRGEADSHPYIEEEERQEERQRDEADASSLADDGADAPPSAVNGEHERLDPGVLPASPSTEAQDRRGAADRDNDAEYVRLASLLAELMVENGCRPPKPGQIRSWQREVRLMVEQDKLDLDAIEAAIRWSQKHPFWRSNILSMGTLREQWDKLLQQARRERHIGSSRASGNAAVLERLEAVRSGS